MDELARKTINPVEAVTVTYPYPFFEHTFSNGKKIQVLEKSSTDLEMVVSEGSRVVFELANLLPKGWKFLNIDQARQYYEKHSLGKVPDSFGADTKNKIVIVYYFNKGAQDIAAVLHELGHANDETKYTRDTDFPPAFRTAMSASQEARRECLAYLYSVNKLVELCTDIGINVRELFTDAESIMSYINQGLRIHAIKRGEAWPNIGDIKEYKEIISQVNKLYDN